MDVQCVCARVPVRVHVPDAFIYYYVGGTMVWLMRLQWRPYLCLRPRIVYDGGLVFCLAAFSFFAARSMVVMCIIELLVVILIHCRS